MRRLTTLENVMNNAKPAPTAITSVIRVMPSAALRELSVCDVG